MSLDGESLERCVASEEAGRFVRDDIDKGVRIGVRGTPTFVLDGRTYPGRIPGDVLAKALSKTP